MAEQNAILTSTVINEDNPDCSIGKGGNNTEDKIFLLSLTEVNRPDYGFSESYDSDLARCISCGEKPESWWLRSPGWDNSGAAYVWESGTVHSFGPYVYSSNVNVCPVLHLDLSACDTWSKGENIVKYTEPEPTEEPEPTAIPEPTATPRPTLIPEGSYGELKSPMVDEKGNVTYSCIYFGSYPQSDITGQEKEPIKWRVLCINGDDAFLVADQNLDVMEYNKTYKDENGNYKNITWENCTMRSWLNGYGSDYNEDGIDYSSNNFIDKAFSSTEQKAILTSNVVNDDNPKYGTEGGNDTKDKIFLLSMDEVSNSSYGFLPYNDNENDNTYDKARTRNNTAYVAAGGTIGTDRIEMAGLGEDGRWWLRSPGIVSYFVANVDYSRLYPYGYNVYCYYNAVCPALHLNLSDSDVWSVAESVTVGGAEPTPTPIVTPYAAQE